MPVERAQPEREQTPGLGATVACVTGSSGAYWERPVSGYQFCFMFLCAVQRTAMSTTGRRTRYEMLREEHRTNERAADCGVIAVIGLWAHRSQLTQCHSAVAIIWCWFQPVLSICSRRSGVNLKT